MRLRWWNWRWLQRNETIQKWANDRKSLIKSIIAWFHEGNGIWVHGEKAWTQFYGWVGHRCESIEVDSRARQELVRIYSSGSIWDLMGILEFRTEITMRLSHQTTDYPSTSNSIISLLTINDNSILGSCLPSSTSDSSSPPVVSPNRESGFGWLALAAALALLLLLIALALCCCLAKKPKKDKPSEFVSKGLPVVFPEEV